MDIKNVNENEIIILQDNTINVLDHRDSHISKGLCFKKSQLFEKIDMIGNMVVTGRSDGIVKIYDLRYNKPKSLNNFKLNGEMYANNKFKKLTVLNSLDIFCHYGCTSFIING